MTDKSTAKKSPKCREEFYFIFLSWKIWSPDTILKKIKIIKYISIKLLGFFIMYKKTNARTHAQMHTHIHKDMQLVAYH